MPSSARDQRLHAAARAAFPSLRLEVVARIDSTQDRVRQAARAGADAGFCCIAQEQTAGRGRQDRRWTAEPRTALLASVLLRPHSMATTLVPLAAGVALCDALADVGLTEAALKWPNDVLVRSRKLAGILAEIEPRAPQQPAVILGVGVNLTVPEFPPEIAGISLHQIIATVPSAENLLLTLLPALRHRLEQAQASPVALLDSWRARAEGLGQEVTVIAGKGRLHGIAADIDSDGALLIDTSTGRVRVLAGDVHLAARGSG